MVQESADVRGHDFPAIYPDYTARKIVQNLRSLSSS